MSNVTQTIPSYTGGLSQQPDEVKVPGQVNIAKNVFPDITEGLSKRPGTRFIKQLDAAGDATDSQDQGKWFHYYRDETEQYLGQVIRHKDNNGASLANDGKVNMWKCSDGSPVTVHAVAQPWVASTAYIVGQKVKNNSNVYECSTAGTSAGSGGPSGTSTDITDGNAKWDYVAALSGLETNIYNYLKHLSDPDVQTLTVNDFTYITNRTKTTALSSTTEAARPPEAFIELKKVAYASQYAVNLFDDTTTTTVTTATRVSAELVNEGIDSALPNVGTKIYSINGIPEAQTIDLSSLGSGAHWYEITDGTTIIGKAFTNVGTADSVYGAYKIAEGLRSHPNYHKLKFTIGNAGTKNDMNDGTNFSDQLRLVFKEGGAQTTLATLKKYDTQGGTLATTYTATKVNNTGENSSDNVKENLYFRVTVTGQAVPHARDQSPTYYGRYQIVIDLLHGGEGWTQGQVIEVGFKGCSVQVTIDKISTSKVQANLGLIRPIPTSFDAKSVVTAESILGQLQEGIESSKLGTTPIPTSAISNNTITVNNHGFTNFQEIKYYSNGGTAWTVTNATPSDGQSYWVRNVTTNTFQLAAASSPNQGISAISATGNDNQYVIKPGDEIEVSLIGNGIYIKGIDAFNLSSPVGELLNVLTDSVKDIADLPNVCKHGYVVKVANSDAEEDDYYVKFFGHNDRDGEGIWEECAKPGTNIEIDPGTMPLQLVRQANGTFTLSTVTWDNAQVGDTSIDGTNPQPSFIGNTINKMMFFRNRLVLLSDENVIMSRPGDFYNFWVKSAIQFTATDPIDISCSSEYPAIIYDGIQVNTGLVLFTKNQQFMLTTDSDILSPLTAKINFISAYNFNHKTNPFSLGTTIGFIDNVGQHSRLMEMARVLREGEPDVIEQSKVVSELLDKDLNIVSSSKENGLLAFSEKDKTTLYCYKFFNTSDKRAHQAWFTWTFPWDIQYHFIIDDSLYIVSDDDGKCMFIKLDLKLHSDTLQTYTGTSTDKENIHPVYLDCATEVSIAANTYSASTNKTTFPLPSNWWTTEAAGGDMVLYETGGNDPVGRYAEVTINGSNIEVVGDWSSTTVVLGILYEMEVEFPTIYLTSLQGDTVRSDTRSSLVLHRNKINLGASGLFQTILKRKGKPTYTEDYEAIISDYSEESELPTQQLQTRVIPIYDRNINTTLTLKSTHPTPLTLYSMTWEGDYTNKFYSSV